ncbi:DNA polymerase/3'-5' exonuclease PolX [Meiothermus hypogaeus]|uniref:DNA polymerase beta n=2 Tax=Meiothermus hypogaeus TaxID=884155 RepID=A0A511R4C0_9DEIN|nr:DNA polymerase/3'-5' exonuclease PolX [Meiothermus hypogaeus]RIH77483.1 DNA polymerase/3'-5' exonuclease PolX [Meiothermus hypogaeus]GEM84449.1 DNA polymerase/3'-5' exonuclease PolX [Meiothermus hypogaeus NBRC 106114]GIW35983.1 MAG: DNA polymerase/3'-5' exonuclease PolX [Meiothermus sp.]
MKNAEIARIFQEMAEMLAFLGENPFRVRAYAQAARTLADLEAPIEAVAAQGTEALEALPAIGPDLAAKIQEYLHTGAIQAHARLAQQVPQGILEVLRVPGVGPKTAKLLWDRLGVNSLETLQAALASGRVRGLPGFGEKKRRHLLENLALAETAAQRRPLGAVLGQARALLEQVRAQPGVVQAEVCGSLRRYRETVGDLDFLIATEKPAEVLAALVRLPGIADVEAVGENRATVFLQGGLQVDFKTVPPAAWGSGLQYLTGSKAHSIKLRTLAQKQGLKLNEYGVWRGKARLAGEDEEGVYRALGLPWIPPPLREDSGEIEAAQGGRLPRLVTLQEIRGDLQVHSRWSDGKASLLELAQAAAKLGYEYLAVTDHSQSLKVAHGVPLDKVQARLKEIRQVNEQTGGKPYLLAGAEVEVLADGSLDYPEKVLRGLEVVLVAVHSHFHLSRAQQTKRILRALEHPAVHILAHPTARMLGVRKELEADWEKIFRRAQALGKALEIDGYYDRMDLPDTLARQAGGMGLLFSLSTDAHQLDHLRFMELAVGTAQRAWLGPQQILNTRSLAALLDWLRAVRG